MFSSPMKMRVTPARAGLFDEVRDLVAQRVHLDDETHVHACPARAAR